MVLSGMLFTRRCNRSTWLLGGFICLTSMTSMAKIGFNESIRPILSDKCFHCHGPDSGTREAGLRLDTAEGLMTDLGGYFAIVPGDPDNSEVYKRIAHQDPEERMPPAQSHKTISEQERQQIYQWIKEGAEWQGHWAFEPITSPSLPVIKKQDWAKNEIDHFVLARLEKEALPPSHGAEKQTLLRRIYLDLTGLPPRYEDIQVFLQDDSENAYEKVVDRLLASEAYGEHRASFWLDAARYADTHGLHLDNYRSIWPYRDWVVDAFNQNMPFDQFTVEQLAGDMLPNPTQANLIATGFSRSNPTTSEGGAIDEEYNAIYANDRTDTMSTVWMGLTASCAGCHDHKFDPISQKEFYQLTAFFRNTTQKAMDENAYDTPPSMHVYSDQQLSTRRQLELDKTNLAAAQLRLSRENVKSIHQWVDKLQANQSRLPVAQPQLAFHLPANEGKGDSLTGYTQTESVIGKLTGKYQWDKGIVGDALSINQSTLLSLSPDAEYQINDAFSVSFWIKTPKADIKQQAIIGRIDVDKGQWDWESKTSGWYVEAPNNKSIRLALDYPGFQYVDGRINDVLTPETWHHIAVRYNGNGNRNAFSFFVDGKPVATSGTKSLVSRSLDNDNANQSVVNPLSIGLAVKPQAFNDNPDDLKIREKYSKTPFLAIQDVRVFDGMLSDMDIGLLASLPDAKKALAQDKTAWSKEQKQLLSRYFSTQLAESSAALIKQRSEMLTTLAKMEKNAPTTLIMQEKPDSKPFAHVLIRGQYDQTGEKVDAGVPAFLPAMDSQDIPNRLDLARWLVSNEHPLTARVTVNRLWQSLFGRGLVETAEDFGSQGTPPSHPQLLDWLASDFRDNGWDVKRAIKQMVMSATYQQSSDLTKELQEKDAENVFLARAHRSRLNAEVIRDQALYVSGLLVDKAGGPPVKPYQPAGLWKAVAYVDSNTAEFIQDHGENLYRKSLYTYRKRTAAPPGMALFDAPDRESCNVRREKTNTPLQALLLMNDPQFIEAARRMGESLMRSHAEDKFAYLGWHALGRTIDQETQSILQSSYQQILDLYQADKSAAFELISVGESEVDPSLDAVQLASWTMLISQVFNLDEFITRN